MESDKITQSYIRSDDKKQQMKEPNDGNNSEKNINRIKDDKIIDIYQDSGYTLQNLEAVQKHKVLFISGQQMRTAPRDQNYWQMLKYTFCSAYSLCSFTTICLLVYLGAFIAEAVIGLKEEGKLLEIQYQTAVMMGANDPQLVRNGEVWRLITAAVLHVDFVHFLGNFVATMVFLSRIEYTIGHIKAFLLYLICGISGNLFSALVKFDEVKMGGSTSLYGALGFSIGYIIINWRGLNKIGSLLKCQVVCSAIFMIIFTVLFTSIDGENIDYFGHLGGFLTGLWIPCISDAIQDNKRETIIRIVFTVLFMAQFIIIIILFIFVRVNSTQSQ